MSGNYGFRSGGVISGSAARLDSTLQVDGNTDVGGDLTITGDLTVNGSTVTINASEMVVEDKNIILADGAANDAAANGGGITLESGDGNKTMQWSSTTTAWTSSEHFDLADGKTFGINSTSVLSADTLGSGVTMSSLEGVGTINTGAWQADSIESQYISELNSFSTDDLTEGTASLYYTDDRVRTAVSATDNGGDGEFSYDNSTGEFTYTGPSAEEARAHFSGGHAIDIADGEISLNASQLTSSTRNTISVTDNGGDGALSYSSETGVISYTGPSKSEVQAHFTNGHLIDFGPDDGEWSVNAAQLTSSVRDMVSVTDTGGDGSLSYASGVFTYVGPSAAEARAHFDASASGDGSFSYDSGTGVFTYVSPSSTELRAHFSAGDGLSVSAGDFSVNVDDSSIETNDDTLQIKALGVTNAMLAGSIVNAKLSNSSVTVGADTIALGGSISDLDLNGAGSLILDADADTLIRAAGDDDLRLEVGSSTAGLKVSSTALMPLAAGMDLGSSAQYFSNIYTGDMHLKNERGDWTIFEESDHLRIRNNATGQTFKMGMTPIEE
tara:strand:+ start:1699 stop:3363 length:1665 start_codon:yes stop_codon:yes gene_type:complete